MHGNTPTGSRSSSIAIGDEIWYNNRREYLLSGGGMNRDHRGVERATLQVVTWAPVHGLTPPRRRGCSLLKCNNRSPGSPLRAEAGGQPPMPGARALTKRTQRMTRVQPHSSFELVKPHCFTEPRASPPPQRRPPLRIYISYSGKCLHVKSAPKSNGMTYSIFILRRIKTKTNSIKISALYWIFFFR